MRGFPIPFALAMALLLVPAFLLDGCFTDVGNAEGEGLIQTEFSIDYSPGPAMPKAGRSAGDSVFISQFYLTVREAEYHLAGGGEYHLWRDNDSGLVVDFTGRDPSATLPARPIGPDSILDFMIEARLAVPPEVNPDTLDFAAFAHPGFMKGAYRSGGGAFDFLFALPGTGRLNIGYSLEEFEAWRWGSGYRMQVVYYALRWMAGTDLSTVAVSVDRNGHPFILIDATHNSALHGLLADRFTQSFNSQRVTVR